MKSNWKLPDASNSQKSERSRLIARSEPGDAVAVPRIEHLPRRECRALLLYWRRSMTPGKISSRKPKRTCATDRSRLARSSISPRSSRLLHQILHPILSGRSQSVRRSNSAITGVSTDSRIFRRKTLASRESKRTFFFEPMVVPLASSTH